MPQKIIKKTKNNKKRKHNNKGYKKIVFAIVLILILIIVIRNKPIKKNNEITQIVLNNENITNKLVSPIIFENNQIYMSYEDIKQFFDETLYTEEDTGCIITTSDRKLAIIKKDDQTMRVNNSNVDVKNIIIEQDNKIYIAISELTIVYNFEIEKIEKTNIITIDMLNKKSVKAYANKSIKIKEDKGVISKAIDEVKKGNWLFFINDENGYAKVRTQDGIIGYVKKKYLSNYINVREDLEIEDKNFKEENSINRDITNDDISTYEKRQKIIDLILHEAIKNDKMYVQISYNGEANIFYERFKIEVVPILKECGIEIKI
ncbi:MAG TPA: hypothetical protein DEP51_04340 [Clostridiales bacterium]|nr:hypothetical protein [Clostridiales bacterium]